MFEPGSSNSRDAPMRGRVAVESSLREVDDMCASLTLDEALARGELFAANTTESTHVIRLGDWVYKFLRPLDADPLRMTDERRRQIRLRVRESGLHRELNPLAYDQRHNCVISRFIAGRPATDAEAADLEEYFRLTRRGYLSDFGPSNVKIVAARTLAIDFAVSHYHPDWRFRPDGVLTVSSEVSPCR